jgi:tetrahydromethanopterin S-methyltransferase subunit B
MMKRLILPGFLLFFLCIYVCTAAHAQDTTKKAETEKKIEPEQKAAVQATSPSTTKPLYRRHRLAPVVTPPAAPVNNAAATVKNAAAIVKKDTAPAQVQADPAQLNDKSLNGQYQYLISKVARYEQPLIAALWKNVTDTLNKERSQLKALQAKLDAQGKVLDSLKTDVNSKEQSLNASTEKVDSISMFGIVLAKSTYNLVMFGLVIGLAIALAIVILTTAKHKYEARHRTELYEEIEEEYKNYKAKATEKELRLARELQTERNKLDELLGRG